MPKRLYTRSEALLSRALKTIPLGSQTFSKSFTQFPPGVSPLFIERGEGATVWDVDKNPYLDFSNALLCVSLGYNDPDVNEAVNAQLKNGVSFSLPHPLEMEVAEKIVAMVPCAEMVRFGKNGSDVTAGAIRVARAHTNRDHVAVCGYHGWQDWYIGTTSKNRGVPQATSSLTHPFLYNDLSSLEAIFKAHPDQVAAVMLEPMNTTLPEHSFLKQVKELCEKNGTVLIFDEMITGFRFSKGGAQEFFGVTPDLACFGKGLANGFPLAALVGKRSLMELLEDLFFSFTFGGETLSLAAANAVLDKLDREPVVETLLKRGDHLISSLNEVIKENDATAMFSIQGHPSWTFLTLEDAGPYSSMEIKTLLLQKLFERGILCLGTHNLSYAHQPGDIETLVATYAAVLPELQACVNDRTLHTELRCEALTPLFTPRA